jgi:CDP-4-dehydro-6-deoxyglucose reductase
LQEKWYRYSTIQLVDALLIDRHIYIYVLFTFHGTVMPKVSLTSGKSFNSVEGSSILEASKVAEISLPYSCKMGRCNSCKCQVISGETIVLNEELGLTEVEKKAGWILSCVREAKTDLLIAVEELGISLPSIQTVPCRISLIEKLSEDVIRVLLRTPPSTQLNFFPGQYVDVIGSAGNRRSYSLASTSNKLLEIHIRGVVGGVMSNYWFNKACVNDLLRINGPLGTFFLRPCRDQDLIFLATGTGIAPIKAMLESLVDVPKDKQPKSVFVYWGGRRYKDLYLDLKEIKFDFSFVPVLSQSDDGWTGDRGYVQHAAIANLSDLTNACVYACGSNDMIKSAKSIMMDAGLSSDRFYSDAFLCSANN